jgi:hypothetical protein
MRKRNVKIPDVRVSETLLAEIRLAGEEEGRSVSDVIRRTLVKEFADRMVERERRRAEAI